MISFSKHHEQVLLERKLLGKEGVINVANTPVSKARVIVEEIFEKNDMSLGSLIPKFDENYVSMQNNIRKNNLGIPRIDMPVIMSDQIKRFMMDIKAGNVDIKSPFAKGSLYTPTNLDVDKTSAIDWLSLGKNDGVIKDDKIKAKLTMLPVEKLKPTQNQIWLDKLANILVEFGIAKNGSDVTKKTMIVSKEGYILDGHHRYAQAFISDPKIKMSVLHVPLDITTLLGIGRSYGNAIGNRQRA